jgi:hypothetical protein
VTLSLDPEREDRGRDRDRRLSINVSRPMLNLYYGPGLEYRMTYAWGKWGDRRSGLNVPRHALITLACRMPRDSRDWELEDMMMWPWWDLLEASIVRLHCEIH